MKKESTLIRFQRRYVVSESGCWLWQGYKSPDGYGRLRDNGKSRLAHRVAHELFIGPIPSGYTIDHVRERGCISRACVNPAHLEAVPHRVNVLRGDTFAAAKAAQTACIHGHEFTPENTYRGPSGRRVCRICLRDKQRRYEERKKR